MKKSKPITVKFRNRVCIVEFGEYDNGRTAIQLDLKSNGEPFIVATHNIPHARLEENEIIIKDFGENEGILDVLVNAGIVKSYNQLALFNGLKWNVVELLIKPSTNQTTMITKNNYFSQVREHSILSRFPDATQYHDFILEATDSGNDWSAYENEAETRQLIDSYFGKLNEKLKVSTESTTRNEERLPSKNEKKPVHKITQRPRGHAKSTKKEKSAKPQKSKKAASKSVKQKQKVLNLPKGKLVELVDPHLLFVGRYLRMNNQKRSHNALSNLFSQINHAADARVLRKASQYAHHILYIQKQLIRHLSGGQEEVSIHIPVAKFNELIRAVAKEQQMASVRLLKRYHNIAGRPTSDEKAKKLYNEMYNAIDKGKIPENDRLFKRVVKVMRDLSDYIKAEDHEAELVRLPAELSGLLGFMDGCLCSKDRELKFLDSPQDVNFNFRN